MASKYECVRTASHLGGDALIYATAVSLNGLSLMATSVVIQTLYLAKWSQMRTLSVVQLVSPHISSARIPTQHAILPIVEAKQNTQIAYHSLCSPIVSYCKMNPVDGIAQTASAAASSYRSRTSYSGPFLDAQELGMSKALFLFNRRIKQIA